MLKSFRKHKNGNILTLVNIYNCNGCGIEFDEMDRWYDFNENTHYCRECAFKKGFIDSKTYLNWCGINVDNFYAAVYPKTNQIIVWTGKNSTPPWNRTIKDYRHTTEYKIWRKSVFERDNYTCQHCNIKGGKLNAHHIKTFKKHKELRYAVDNGITLCEICHRSEHKKVRN